MARISGAFITFAALAHDTSPYSKARYNRMPLHSAYTYTVCNKNSVAPLGIRMICIPVSFSGDLRFRVWLLATLMYTLRIYNTEHALCTCMNTYVQNKKGNTTKFQLHWKMRGRMESTQCKMCSVGSNLGYVPLIKIICI